MAKLAQQFMNEKTAPGAWFLLLVPLVFLLLRYSTRKQKNQQPGLLHLPPSPPALPILGHLHLIGSLPHVSLRNLAAKHGADLMLLRLGAMPALLVTSPRAAEAVLRTHDHVLASRPHSLATEIIMYGHSDIGFAPYGECWRQAKKLVTTHLLNTNKVWSFRLAREDEVSMVMAKISEAAAAGAAVDMTRLFGSFMNDLACRAVMGKDFQNKGLDMQFLELIADTSPLISKFNMEEYFPFLARFGVLSKTVRGKSERVKRRWDKLLDGLIQEHEVSASDPKDRDNFMHVLLSVREEYGLTREQMNKRESCYL